MAVTNARQTKRRAENNFSGGINTEQATVSVGDNESTDEYGFDTDQFPNLTTRKGRQKYGSSGGAVTNLLTNFSDQHLVRAVGQTLQYNSSGTTWTNIPGTFANTYWDAANFEVAGAEALILTNGTDAVRYWNGTSLSNLGGSPPRGKYITADPSRVFIAKDDIIYFCKFQDPSDWSAAEDSGFLQYYTFSGGDITALYNYKDIKYVWKEDSMAGLYGVNYFDYRLMEVSNSIGCVSARTIQEVNGRLIWLGMSDVYIFTQGNPSAIGGKIKSYIDRINRAYIDKCSAFSDGHRYYLNLVIDGATEPNIRLVFDTRYGIWRVPAKNENYRRGVFFKNTLYAGDSSGQTYKVNEGETDDGVAIPWSVTSKAFNEGIGEAEKEYKELHIQGHFPSTSTLNLSISMQDRGESFISIEYDPIGTSNEAVNKNLIVPLDTVPLTYWMRERIIGTGPVSIYNTQRYFRVCRVQH